VRTVVDRLRQARHTESTAHRMGAVAIAPGSAKRGRIVQRPHADQPVARLPAGGWRLAAGGGRRAASGFKVSSLIAQLLCTKVRFTNSSYR
jgi:hypothetical protein